MDHSLVSHFRFKVFADYEAYVACQAQVDQLYRVWFSGPRAGGGGPGRVAAGDIYEVQSREVIVHR